MNIWRHSVREESRSPPFHDDNWSFNISQNNGWSYSSRDPYARNGNPEYHREWTRQGKRDECVPEEIRSRLLNIANFGEASPSRPTTLFFTRSRPDQNESMTAEIDETICEQGRFKRQKIDHLMDTKLKYPKSDHILDEEEDMDWGEIATAPVESSMNSTEEQDLLTPFEFSFTLAGNKTLAVTFAHGDRSVAVKHRNATLSMSTIKNENVVIAPILTDSAITYANYSNDDDDVEMNVGFNSSEKCPCAEINSKKDIEIIEPISEVVHLAITDSPQDENGESDGTEELITFVRFKEKDGSMDKPQNETVQLTDDYTSEEDIESDISEEYPPLLGFDLSLGLDLEKSCKPQKETKNVETTVLSTGSSNLSTTEKVVEGSYLSESSLEIVAIKIADNYLRSEPSNDVALTKTEEESLYTESMNSDSSLQILDDPCNESVLSPPEMGENVGERPFRESTPTDDTRMSCENFIGENSHVSSSRIINDQNSLQENSAVNDIQNSEEALLGEMDVSINTVIRETEADENLCYIDNSNIEKVLIGEQPLQENSQVNDAQMCLDKNASFNNDEKSSELIPQYPTLNQGDKLQCEEFINHVTVNNAQLNNGGTNGVDFSCLFRLMQQKLNMVEDLSDGSVIFFSLWNHFILKSKIEKKNLFNHCKDFLEHQQTEIVKYELQESMRYFFVVLLDRGLLQGRNLMALHRLLPS